MPQMFAPETEEQLSDRRAAVARLLREHDGRNLTQAELGRLLPARAPRRHPQNRVRGHILALLNRAGFRFEGKRLS